MAKRKQKGLGVDEPLFFDDHARPVTRRDFLRQGLSTGAAVVAGGGFWGLFASPRQAMADLSQDIQDMASAAGCPVGGPPGGMVPFICFDLAGGANYAASNVLAGITDGFGSSTVDPMLAQLENMSASGFSRLGVPNEMIPGTAEGGFLPQAPGSNGDFTNNRLGLYFHSDSALLMGILDKFASIDGGGGIDGCVVPARSENDTGNNPHNPMYGIARTGANGEITTLVGSRSSDSGGNSLSPMNLIDPTIRPTKIDRPSDVAGLIDTGKLVGLLAPEDAVAVLESVARLSQAKLGRVSTGLVPSADEVIKDLIRCGYTGAADIAERFGGRSIDPSQDPLIVDDATGIFGVDEFNRDREFQKTASVMKMVIDGYAGAGTITMGGYDYHVGDRETGERRDLRAGRCMGACLEYAARMNTPLMIYAFSDGSVFSNGNLDMSDDGRGKGEWTGDNQSGAASFFLVYNPTGAVPISKRQIGWFRMGGDVETSSTPVANNVNSLVDLVVLNYLALHGRQGELESLIPSTVLQGTALKDRLTAFGSIV